MTIVREIPESQITCIADQFCRAAELLYESRAVLAAIQAIRVNAVLSIELYLKSLDSHWVHRSKSRAEGAEDHVVTSKSDERGHNIEKLFESIDDEIKSSLIAAFTQHPLNVKYPALRPMLREYANTFEKDRYIYENSDDEKLHSISETVELVRFFRDTVHTMSHRRIWATGTK